MHNFEFITKGYLKLILTKVKKIEIIDKFPVKIEGIQA